MPESLAPSWILNLKWEVGSQIFVSKVWNIVWRWDDHYGPEAHRSDLVKPETSWQGIGKETFPVNRVQDFTTVRTKSWLRDEIFSRPRRFHHRIPESWPLIRDFRFEILWEPAFKNSGNPEIPALGINNFNSLSNLRYFWSKNV